MQNNNIRLWRPGENCQKPSPISINITEEQTTLNCQQLTKRETTSGFVTEPLPKNTRLYKTPVSVSCQTLFCKLTSYYMKHTTQVSATMLSHCKNIINAVITAAITNGFLPIRGHLAIHTINQFGPCQDQSSTSQVSVIQLIKETHIKSILV